MAKYIVVSIGNTDGKLSQEEWSDYVDEMGTVMNQYKIHFFGGSSNWEDWQNVAWIVEIPVKVINVIMAEISSVRKKYNQESAFFMVADGMFI